MLLPKAHGWLLAHECRSTAVLLRLRAVVRPASCLVRATLNPNPNPIPNPNSYPYLYSNPDPNPHPNP